MKNIKELRGFQLLVQGLRTPSTAAQVIDAMLANRLPLQVIMMLTAIAGMEQRLRIHLFSPEEIEEEVNRRAASGEPDMMTGAEIRAYGDSLSERIERGVVEEDLLEEADRILRDPDDFLGEDL